MTRMLKLGMVVPIKEYNPLTGELYQKTNLIVDRWDVVIAGSLPRKYNVVAVGREVKSGWVIDLAPNNRSARMCLSIPRLLISLRSWYGNTLLSLSGLKLLAGILLKDELFWDAAEEEYGPLTTSERWDILGELRDRRLIGPVHRFDGAPSSFSTYDFEDLPAFGSENGQLEAVDGWLDDEEIGEEETGEHETEE